MGDARLRQPVERAGLGEALQFRGQSWLVVGYEGLPGVSERRVIVEREGTQTSIGWSDFWMAIEAAAAKPICEDMADHLPRAAFDDLTEAEQEALFPRIRDTLQILTGSRTGTPELDRERNLLDPAFDPATTQLPDRIKAMLDRQTHEPARRSRMTLYRDCGGLQSLGLNYFVHGNRRTTGSLPPIDADTEIRLREVVTQARVGPKVSQAHLASEARTYFGDHGWPLPLADGELNRWLGFLTRGKGLHREARSRETLTNRPQGVFGRLTATRPGEYVQIDATDTAIHCLFTGLGWARASILIAVDVFSRSVVALRVVPGRANSRDVALLLYDMALPHAMRAGFPYDYQCYCGVPRLVEITTVDGERTARFPEVIGEKPAVQATHVVFDRGREMENLHLMAVAEETGIGLVFCPPGAPYAKGIIESINRMVTRLQELLPAYKGASPANHPKGVESRALLTVGDLQDALWTYVLQIYHHTPHKELKNPAHPSQKLSPAQAYQNYLDHGGWIPITTRWDRILSFLPRERRTVQDYGINLHNHVYNSPELIEIRQHIQRGVGARAVPLTVYYDPYDVTRIFLRHPVTQKWLRIPIWDPMGLAMPPYSQVLANAALEQLLDDPLRLTKSELRQAEAKFQAAWSRGVFEDRREQRAAALEAQRRAQHAFDLELAGDEFREFGYGPASPAVPPEATYPDDSDDDVLTYDDLELDGMAW